MQKISLLIQPFLRASGNSEKFEYLDLMDEDLITLTQVLQDVKNIDKIFTDFTKTFNLPASKTNNKIFRNWYNQDVVGFDNQTFSNAKIQLNHLDFKTGKLKLENVVMKNNKPSIYKVTFFGNTVSINDLMSEDSLDTLLWLNNFNTVATATNIKNGLKDGLDFTVDSVAYTDAIIFPLITHSQRYILDNTGQTSNVGNISTTGDNNDKRGVLPEDLKPAIKVTLVIKAIEQRYGLTFKTGGFFDSSAMDGLYLWLHRDIGKIKTGGTWIGLQTPSNPLEYTGAGDTTELTNTLNRPGNFIMTGQGAGMFFQKRPELGSQTGTPVGDVITDGGSYSIKITPSTLSTQYTIDIMGAMAGNNYVLATLQNVTGVQTLTLSLDFPNDFPYAFAIIPIYPVINASSTFQFASEITINRNTLYRQPVITSSGVIQLQQVRENKTAVFTSTVTNLTPTGGAINMTDQTPKIKVVDFLKGLFKMHNLTAFVNNENEIVVKSLNNFYGGGDVLNLTEYIKTDEHTIESTLPFSEVKFEYPEPKTILAQQFLNTNNRKFGSLDFFSSGNTTKKYNIKAPFEHMIFERLTFGGTASTEVMYGLHLDEDLKPSLGAPLLFYANNVTITNSNSEINFVDSLRPTDGGLPDTGTRTSLNKFWMPANTNTTTPTQTKANFDLNFGNEINEYSLRNYSGITNSLFELYYKSYIQRVFNVKTRLCKFKCVLPLRVLLKLSLDDKIIVGTNLYTINKMTTKLQSGETDLELLSEAT